MTSKSIDTWVKILSFLFVVGTFCIGAVAATYERKEMHDKDIEHLEKKDAELSTTLNRIDTKLDTLLLQSAARSGSGQPD